MNFLSLRLYVKSNSRSAKCAILKQIGIHAMNSDFDEFLHFLKAEIYSNHKFRVSKSGKNGTLSISRLSKIDFT